MSEGIGDTYDQLGTDYLAKLEEVGPPPDLEPFAQSLPAGGLVLDAGCAGGRDSKRFVEHGLHVTGVDLSEKFIEEAQKNVPEGTFMVGDLMDLSFPPDTFDAVWANAVLVHLPKDQLVPALKSFARVEKSGAKLFLRMKERNPDMTEEQEREASEGRAGSFTYFTQDEARAGLQEAGFELTTLESVGSARPGLRWIKIWAVKK